MFQSIHDVIDPRLEMRKREILGPDPRGAVEMFLGDMRERSLEIGKVFFGETNDPATGVGEFVASPYIRTRYRLGENLGHRRRSFAAYPFPAAHCRAGYWPAVKLPCEPRSRAVVIMIGIGHGVIRCAVRVCPADVSRSAR